MDSEITYFFHPVTKHITKSDLVTNWHRLVSIAGVGNTRYWCHKCKKPFSKNQIAISSKPQIK